MSEDRDRIHPNENGVTNSNLSIPKLSTIQNNIQNIPSHPKYSNMASSNSISSQLPAGIQNSQHPFQQLTNLPPPPPPPSSQLSSSTTNFYHPTMLKATDVQSKASSSMTPFTSPPPQAPPSVATKLSTAFHLPHAPPSSAGLYPISHPPTHNNNSHDGNGHGKFAPGSNSNSSFINSSLIPPPPPSSLSKGLYSTNHPIIPPPPPMIASIPSNPYQMPPTGNIPHMNSIPPPPLPGDYNNANNYSDKGDNSARSPRVDDHQNASVQSSPRYDLNTDSPRYGSVDSRPTSGPRRGNSRIDPSQMPRPPHLETDIVFYTRSGTTRRVPPLSNSGFQAIDNGNSSPRYIRATTVAPGISNVVQLSTGLPLGLIITPFASPENGEEPVPIVDYGGELPPRCSRCRGYVNCSVEWIADGNSWRCNLCSMVNAVPAWYFSSLDGAGLRLDRNHRPELIKGSVDFAATSDYCTRPLQTPIYVFAIDISSGALSSGHTVCSIKAIQSAISILPSIESRVGIFTYDSKIQFYYIRESAIDPVRLMIVDPDDPTPPLPHPLWILPVKTHQSSLELLLRKVSELVPSSNNSDEPPSFSSGYKNPYTIPTRTCPTAALKIAQVALEEIGGQIYLFTASNPTLGYGRVPKIRETMSIYGTDSELFLYGALEKLEDISTDANEKRIFNEYISLANSCIESQISINILVTADTLDEFRDIGLFSHPCELTGGRLFYLTGSLLIEDNILRLQSQLMSSIQTVTAYEAVLKVRTSVGLKVTDLIGPGSYIKVDDELRAATLDQTTTFACALQHTSSIKDEEKFYFQVAVLYTSPDKHRRIRIHNLCLIGTSFPAVLFKHADLDGTVAFFTKSSVHKALYERYSSPDENGPRAWLTTGLVDVLYKYRHSCSESSPRTQLILPESLKLLPLYTLGLMKHPALIENKSSSIPKKGANTAGNDKPAIDTRGPSATFVVNARAHERAFEIRRLRSASVKEVINSLYPRLFALHAVADDETIEVPPAEQSQELDLQNIPRLPSLCSEYFDLNGLYLLSDQSAIYLYIGRSVPSDDIYQWFGIDIAHIHHRPKQISFSRDSHTARRMQGVVDIIRHHSTHKQEIRVVWGDDPSSPTFERLSLRMIEDSIRGELSYVDFLCKLHAKIQSKK